VERKGGRRVNMMQKMCAHACKCKKWYLLKLFWECGERMIKESRGGGESKYDVFKHL
jgi:hypothetical protein